MTQLALQSLTDREIALILAIRTRFRYGEVIIVVRDGEPRRIQRAFETEDLDSKPSKRSD